MKVGVIGIGIVGGAVQYGLELVGHDVKTHDTKYSDSSIDNVLDTAVCFVCVPTNTKETGENDTSVVESVVQELNNRNYAGLITIKSTVLPGTTDRLKEQYPKLKLAFCPEFLRERAAVIDFVENHDVCVIGAYTDEDYELIKDAHGHLPESFSKLTPKEAEFVKYFSNVFNALRITFANEFYEVCKAVGVDYAKVKNAAVKRKNIPDVYLDCHEGLRGFAGVCLPKDTSAFAWFAKKLGLDMKLFETIVEENKKFPRTTFDGMRPDQVS